MKKLIFILTIFLASCKGFTPSPAPNPGGVYQGFDSLKYDNGNIYGKANIGSCLTMTPLNDGCFIFQNIVIKPDNTVYRFDSVYMVEYSDEKVIRKIRKSGTCTFGYNFLMINYTIGEEGMIASHYKFAGWKN